jgi:hypothetical protein
MSQEFFYENNQEILKDNNLINEIKEFQNNYYSVNKKNFFFKKKQKLDCANNICDNFSLQDLINKTIYIIPDTNIIFMDYVIFKIFANSNNYQFIVDYIILLIDDRINIYNTFEIHVNLDSFTISSLERYKSIINIFIDNCLKKNSGYTFIISKVNILNAPKSFDSIINTVKHFFNKDVYQKIVVSNEEDSKIKLDYYYNIRDQ